MLGAFGTLTVGVVLAEVSEVLSLLLVALTAAAAVFILSRRRRRARHAPPQPVLVPAPVTRRAGAAPPVERVPAESGSN